MRLAEFMLDVIFPPRDTDAIVRGSSSERLKSVLSPVTQGEGRHATISLFPYTDTLAQACILEAKFEDNMHATKLLASALHEFLYEFLALRAVCEPTSPVLVPLPLSETRLQERGYNQTERIVRCTMEIGLHADIDIDLLRRTRSTKPQTSLSGHARRVNVAGAFEAVHTCDPFRTYIVVDDVITTGNTMLAACEALRAGGAKRLLPLTLAY